MGINEEDAEQADVNLGHLPKISPFLAYSVTK